MRNVSNLQLQLGELDIADIKIDTRSRDDIPQLLQGLQYLYTDKALRTEVFSVLEKLTPETTSADHGRPGMTLWNVLVMGTLRLNLNCDYDRLLELVNQHKTIRQMLGHGLIDDDETYSLQTLRDNVQKFTPEVLDEINQIVVRAGQSLKKKETLTARCDSFVVETDVHYPTDINLLFDAMRKTIKLTADYAESNEIIGWRQSQYNIRQVKQAYRKAQQKKRSTSQDEAKKALRDEFIAHAHQELIDISQRFIAKSQATLAVTTQNPSMVDLVRVLQIEGFIKHAQRQIDQINRRVLQEQKIPHEEKVFSLFQPHTEWISKGKAGVPVELGLKVCVLEDSQGYILHHRVMQHETDNQIALDIIAEAKRKYPTLNACSFDKGFHSPENQLGLAELLDQVVLPKKGRCNKAEQAKESSPDFRRSKKKHSAVESGINALEVHGLDKCLDHGLEGFKRYVALAVVARNIQKMGAELIKAKRLEEEREKERERKRA